MGHIKINKVENQKEFLPKICDLDYGVAVTGVPSGRECVYIKVKKLGRRDRQKLYLTWSEGCCVLFNLDYGTLREIPGETRVQPLHASLEIVEPRKNELRGFLKEKV